MISRVLRSTPVVDWLPSAVVAALLVAFAALNGRTLTVGIALAAIAGTLPLGVRHRLPFWVLMVPFVGGIVLEVSVVNPGAWVILLPVVMLFDLAQAGDHRRTRWLVAVTLPGIAISVIPFVHGTGNVIRALVQSVLLCLFAIVAGDGLRARRLVTERTLAEQRARSREHATRQRLQIAHEIHDTVAHAMTAINVQAGVAAHLLDRDPGMAHDALCAIRQTSADALDELRAVLGVLREPDGEAPLAPAANLTDLTPLVDGLRAAGIEVAVRVVPVDDLSEVVQATGYRIVQEATTNILRHAHATTVQVALARDADDLHIEITDDGVGAPASATGNGTSGMTERAAALGGHLVSCPAAPHGWSVRARLPLQAAPAS